MSFATTEACDSAVGRGRRSPAVERERSSPTGAPWSLGSVPWPRSPPLGRAADWKRITSFPKRPRRARAPFPDRDARRVLRSRFPSGRDGASCPARRSGVVTRTRMFSLRPPPTCAAWTAAPSATQVSTSERLGTSSIALCDPRRGTKRSATRTDDERHARGATDEGRRDPSPPHRTRTSAPLRATRVAARGASC